MGWDAFGLPAEQHAINTGEHPAGFTRKTIANFKRQLSRFGFAYDWSREFATIDEDYYAWTQWIFLQIYGSWFDAQAQCARPITELEAEFALRQPRGPVQPAGVRNLSGRQRTRSRTGPRLVGGARCHNAAACNRFISPRVHRRADRELVPQTRHGTRQ